MTHPDLTLRAVHSVAVDVPMTYVLGTSQQAVRTAPLLLIDVETEEGIIGRSYLFCYLPAAAPAIAAMLGEIEQTMKGQRIAPQDLWATLTRRFMLIGVQGIVRMAMSGFDVACWDALAIAAKQPLVTFLGGTAKPIPAYNSCGLGLKDPGALADEAEQLQAGGFTAMKVRLGYPTLEQDIAAVRAVRRRLGDDAKIMVDYNQALSIEDALERGRALDGEGVFWLEEPIRHDHYDGYVQLTNTLKTPIQIGENFSLVYGMADALAADACDYVMPDLERIGGVTGWLRAAELAAAGGYEMSSHLFPEVSAHLLAVTPTAHFVEYMDWANAIVQQPLRIADGHAVIPDRPGNGLVWDDKAVAKFRAA